MASHLALIAGQLNAPFGPVVRTEDVAQALREGSVSSIEAEDWIKSLIACMFVELSPDTIGWATLEAGSKLENTWMLYEEARKNWGMPRAQRWEDALEGVL